MIIVVGCWVFIVLGSLQTFDLIVIGRLWSFALNLCLHLYPLSGRFLFRHVDLNLRLFVDLAPVRVVLPPQLVLLHPVFDSRLHILEISGRFIVVACAVFPLVIIEGDTRMHTTEVHLLLVLRLLRIVRGLTLRGAGGVSRHIARHVS